MTRKIGTLLTMVLSLVSTIASAQVIPPTPNTIVSTGDSFVRRTFCDSYPNNYNAGDANFCIAHEHSFHTYLNSASAYQLIGVSNTARGGETCMVFPAGHPYRTLSAGIWINQPRGLSHSSYGNSRLLAHTRNDTFAIMLGINDVNLGGSSATALSSCLQGLYYLTAVTGNRKVIAMTYPPISPETTVWSMATSGPIAAANVAIVNDAIRSAVVQHNLNYPTRKVHLAETSLAWTASQVEQHTIPSGVASIDRAHPNSLGALKLARALYKSVCDAGYLACSSHL